MIQKDAPWLSCDISWFNSHLNDFTLQVEANKSNLLLFNSLHHLTLHGSTAYGLLLQKNIFPPQFDHSHSSAPQVSLFLDLLPQHLHIWETIQRHLQKLRGTAACRPPASPPTSKPAAPEFPVWTTATITPSVNEKCMCF